MKVFCLVSLVRSNLLHTTYVTVNMFFLHIRFIELLESRQVDSAETNEIAESPQILFPSRINYLQPTIISAHGNKPYFDVSL